MKFKKVLVPTDCSALSRVAIEHAAGIAELTGATVDVIHVAARPDDYLPLDSWIAGGAGEASLATKMREAASSALATFVESLPEAQRSRIGTRVELGQPYEVIMSVGEKDGYDLIVMGTHGHAGANQFVLGSVAERVVRGAHCPVLVVR